MMYTILEHRHRFSLWAGARAANRGLRNGNITAFKKALDDCGLFDFLQQPDVHELNSIAFDKYHKQWCEKIIGSLIKSNVDTITYGRAAKFVAIYLKTMVVLGANAQSNLSNIIHPPIDSILLINLSKSTDFDNDIAKYLKSIKWTALDSDSYYDLVNILRNKRNPQEPFWTIEKHWNPC